MANFSPNINSLITPIKIQILSKWFKKHNNTIAYQELPSNSTTQVDQK